MLSFVLVRLQPFYFPFSFSLAFCFTKIVYETLCKFLNVYASLICIFMQGIMINRKLFGNFGFSQHLYRNVLSFYFFVSRFSLCLDYSEENENRKEKAVFCRNTSVFVANKTLIFSDLSLYRVIYTPPPPFLTLAGWVSSRPKIFYFFIFYFFVKYYDFVNSAFLPNFEHFLEHHIYF